MRVLGMMGDTLLSVMATTLTIIFILIGDGEDIMMVIIL
ncbi:MAG: hypothetical protein BWX65_00050 [Bacteroidetes bacterium ADurb.Bin057]|nr:MAG: hypothetical protein BWX65_00050 [Bacteroidetes bacterium ADurb.Bin057]